MHYFVKDKVTMGNETQKRMLFLLQALKVNFHQINTQCGMLDKFTLSDFDKQIQHSVRCHCVKCYLLNQQKKRK